MLKISQRNGAQWVCDICQTPILAMTEALALWRPLNGPLDHADVLVIHMGCREASLTTMLLPKHNKGPLGVLLAQADEAINR